MGRLEICVCGARNVGNIQKIGKVDPYVKVKVQEQRNVKAKYKTQVVNNKLNPVWNEFFKFQIADVDTTQILFELWNDNIMADDLMGSYRLSLNGFKRGVVQDMWVILTGAKLTTAELHLRVLAVDFGREPDPGDAILGSLEEASSPVPAKQTTRPNVNVNADEKMSTYPINLRPPPQVVVNKPQYNIPIAAPALAAQPQPACYGNPQPPYQAPPQPAYYSNPQPPYQAPPQPVYYSNPQPPYQAPPQPAYFGNPPPQPMYPPGPQQFARPDPAVQRAYGVPPTM